MLKSRVIHTIEAGNEIPHRLGICKQCDDSRIWIKKHSHEQYHLGVEDFPKQKDCEYCKNVS